MTKFLCKVFAITLVFYTSNIFAIKDKQLSSFPGDVLPKPSNNDDDEDDNNNNSNVENQPPVESTRKRTRDEVLYKTFRNPKRQAGTKKVLHGLDLLIKAFEEDENERNITAQTVAIAPAIPPAIAPAIPPAIPPVDHSMELAQIQDNIHKYAAIPTQWLHWQKKKAELMLDPELDNETQYKNCYDLATMLSRLRATETKIKLSTFIVTRALSLLFQDIENVFGGQPAPNRISHLASRLQPTFILLEDLCVEIYKSSYSSEEDKITARLNKARIRFLEVGHMNKSIRTMTGSEHFDVTTFREIFQDIRATPRQKALCAYYRTQYKNASGNAAGVESLYGTEDYEHLGQHEQVRVRVMYALKYLQEARLAQRPMDITAQRCVTVLNDFAQDNYKNTFETITFTGKRNEIGK